ncbi:hypothetical protein ONE63_008887 [Megalurothrips usitatus]|uniref:Aminopeptidase N n=1 Tax=Megalurothrips usitatus TaxID=439358 RepID=A0AAV7XHU1_9NEOP|nr:hypothetical protein ONE63_008887 [Megalurothrips usitatus]
MARSLPLLPLVLGLVVGVLLERPSVLGQLRDGDDGSNVTTWLPRDLLPQHYRVRIQPILEEGNFTAPAELEFTFFARRATNRVVLNVRNLEVSEASVTVEEESIPHTWTPLPVAGHEYDADLETYAVVLGAGLRPGRVPGRYRLRMRYVAPVSEGAAGLYRVSYTDQNNTGRWMAMTQLHPTNARTMFPCLDEPQYKAPLTLSVARRREHTSVTNAPLLSSEPMCSDDDWVWDHFETSVPMSSYLIALAVFDFDKIESRYSATAADGDVTFRVWSRASQLPRGAYAARIGPRVLRYYADIFNIPFPLPKQDMVATPKLTFQAMENWGLIFFRENGLLVNEADPGSRHFVAETVAHELAHQWFGNLVTMRWWNDVWLNEGFATYLSQLGVQHVEPQWRSEGVFVLETMQAVMQKDALPSSHPVSREVHRVSDIDHIFDEISYQKGASVVRMMSEFLGAEAFQRGLNAYLRRHAYGNAAQDDLWAALTEASNAHGGLPPGQTVKGIMDSWTLRTGFPVVRVQRDYSRGTAGVTQQRFLVGPAPAPQAEADCCWGVPLWVKTSNGKTSSEVRERWRGEPNKSVPR